VLAFYADFRFQSGYILLAPAIRHLGQPAANPAAAGKGIKLRIKAQDGTCVIIQKVRLGASSRHGALVSLGGIIRRSGSSRRISLNSYRVDSSEEMMKIEKRKLSGLRSRHSCNGIEVDGQTRILPASEGKPLSSLDRPGIRSLPYGPEQAGGTLSMAPIHHAGGEFPARQAQ
jgi:hypothetical protein